MNTAPKIPDEAETILRELAYMFATLSLLSGAEDLRPIRAAINAALRPIETELRKRSAAYLPHLPAGTEALFTEEPDAALKDMLARLARPLVRA